MRRMLILLVNLFIITTISYGGKTAQKDAVKAINIVISEIEIESVKWQELEKGLLYKEFKAPKRSSVTKVKPYNIVVLKIDLNFFKLELFNSSKQNSEPVKVTKWAENIKSPILFNAGMFKYDMVSNVGFMKDFEHYNNSNFVKKYKSFIVFNPKNDKLPAFDIVNIESKNELKKLEKKYNTIIQNLRMIGNGKNKWSAKSSSTRFSELCLGVDNNNNNCLIIFTRAPYNLYEFNNMLLKLPLNLKNVCHLEGGPEATLFIDYNNFKRNFIGSYEDNFVEDDRNYYLYELPNVIGVKKR